LIHAISISENLTIEIENWESRIGNWI
jgi:hypothetical protein